MTSVRVGSNALYYQPWSTYQQEGRRSLHWSEVPGAGAAAPNCFSARRRSITTHLGSVLHFLASPVYLSDCSSPPTYPASEDHLASETTLRFRTERIPLFCFRTAMDVIIGTKAEVPKWFEHYLHWEHIATLPKNITHFGKNSISPIIISFLRK